MALRRKLTIFLLAVTYLLLCSGIYAAGDIKVKIRKYNDDKSGLVWVSIPSGLFNTLSDAVKYINKEDMQIKAVLKQMPDKNLTARYSYESTFKTWIGTDFKLVDGEAIGLIIKGKKADFNLPEEWKSIKIEMKGGNTYAVSLPYKKYKKLSDIADILGHKASEISVWSSKDGQKLSLKSINNEWVGINSQINKFDAVFITVKEDLESIYWTP